MKYEQKSLLQMARGEGKSTFAAKLMAEALEQQVPVLAYSGELPDYHFRRWLDLQLAGPQNLSVSYNNFSDPVCSVPDKVANAIGEWYRGRAYIYDNTAAGDDEEEGLLDTIEQAVCRFGIRFVCIDNLMTAIDAETTDKQYLQQSRFVRALKQLAVKHDIVVLLVAHPRKTLGVVDDIDVVSGSADITNRVDTVLSYVKNKDDEPAGGKLFVLKNRMTGKLATGDHAIPLAYDDRSKRIYGENSRLNFSYGWEQKPSDESVNDLPF